MDFFIPEIISLKDSKEFNEKWVQDIIINNPSILGLGDLIFKDSERIQSTGGRLDLLFYDPESNIRYEVELQLGKTDETHIIRTIEYWDNERKKFPQYEHCSVIIAEEITSRFFNVISLFNGTIPIIALQLNAIKADNKIGLIFTKILDLLKFGTEEEDSDKLITDRLYWEKTGSKESVELADKILKITQTIAPGYQHKYNKHYIGLSKDGISNNFISMIPRKRKLIVSIKLEKSNEIDEKINDTDLDLMSYDNQWKQYNIRLNSEDIENNKKLLEELIKLAFDKYMAN